MPTLKKDMERWRNTAVNGVCDEYPVPQMTLKICLQRIGSKSIKFENASPLRKQVFISQSQVKYVEDITVTKETENIGMSSKEVIHMISEIGQASSYVQAENHLDLLIQ